MQKQYLLGPMTWKVFFYDKRNESDEVNLTHAMTWKVVPISWMCKKQTSVSYSSTEAEIYLSKQVYAWMESQLKIFGI